MKHVKYLSSGNSAGLDENIECYWEVDEKGFVVRSIEKTPTGGFIKYSELHSADCFGQLPEGVITQENLNDSSYGKVKYIKACEFESIWNQSTLNLGK